jgi:hypothetical protein
LAEEKERKEVIEQHDNYIAQTKFGIYQLELLLKEEDK